MKARIFALLAVAGMLFVMLPAHADDPDPRVTHVKNFVNRIPPGVAGEQRHVTLVYGPYVIPPGQDNNKITADIPVQTGFYTSVFPNLIDATTGKEPTEQDAHIHHAHWFRVTNDSQYEYYEGVGGAGLSWVFGTGEERTGGTLVDRESPNEGWGYGIFLDGSTPQALIFMIHNKQTKPLTAYITLDIDMIYGTRDAIKSATGKDIHPLRGVLTGTTQDAAANKVVNAVRSVNGVLMQDYAADFSGTLVASASHMHPGGKWVYVTNQGPKVNGKFICGGSATDAADLDGDGIPGTTLFVSKKIDQVAAAWPYSEDYQMGGTQGGFRAPVHQGDVIRQYGVYDELRSSASGLPAAVLKADPLSKTDLTPDLASTDGQTHAWYAAMSYTGLYSDTDNKPAHADGIGDASLCTASTFASYKVPTNGHFDWSSDARETGATHPWLHFDPVCGVPDPNRGGATFACDRDTPITYNDGISVSTIHVANFVYLPGDLSVRNLDGTMNVPLVKKGTTLQLVNDDLSIGVRHTFTSCLAQCDGEYVANYPLPDGLFDSGKLGNLDYIDGGLTGADTVPIKSLEINDSYQVGKVYTYYCQIHPRMRGAFKVVA